MRPDGAFSILDGGITWASGKSFPFHLANLVLVARFSFGPSECGKEYNCSVKVSAPDGNVLQPDLVIILKPELHKRHPETNNTFTAKFQYDRIQFLQAGFYRFSIFIDDTAVGEAVFEVFEDSSP
jgi:hypothetical protein